MNESISHKSILYLLIGLLSVRHQNNDYIDEYKRIIYEIAKELKKSRFIVAGKDDKIKIAADEMMQKMVDVSSFISLVINQYYTGRITDANWSFKTQWEKTKIPNYKDEINNRIYYRMRNRNEEEGKDYVPSDLLHIPLNKRGIIANQRFSINGFPCLYASTSLYQCWEELRRPRLNNLYAAGLLFSNNMKLFDLRLIRTIKNEEQLRAYMTRLPLIIACSIKTREDNDTFKPEYIISQILLHHIINKKDKIDGILFSSMRKDYDFFNADETPEDSSRNENIVIPAKVTIEKDTFVDNLLNMTEVTIPLNFEQEIIKGSIFIKSTAQYEETIFGQMEKLLLSAKIYRSFDNFSLPMLSASQRLTKIECITQIV